MCFKVLWLINVLYDGIGIFCVGLEGVDNLGINNIKEVLEDVDDVGFGDVF